MYVIGIVSELYYAVCMYSATEVSSLKVLLDYHPYNREIVSNNSYASLLEFTLQ